MASTIIKLELDDKATPELKKAGAEVQKLYSEINGLKDKLTQLKSDRTGILKGAIKSDIEDIRKLQDELKKLKEKKAPKKDIIAKEHQLRSALTKEIIKQQNAISRLNKELEKNKIILDRNYKKHIQQTQAIKKETQVTKVHTSALKKDNAVRRSLGVSIVRHIRQIESLVVALYGLNRAYSGTAGRGVELHRQIESQTAGIGALISANTKLRNGGSEIEKFQKSMHLAQQVVMDLKKASVETAATFPELTAVFQQAIGGALGAGKAMGETTQEVINNTIKLSQRMTNIASAIGMPMVQVNEEIRSLIEGATDINSRISKMLGITNEQIKQAKQEVNGLVKMLDKILIPFDQLKDLNTFDRLLARIKDAFDSILLQGTQEYFNKFKHQLGELYEYIRTNRDTLATSLANFLHEAVSIGKQVFSVIKEIVSFIKQYWGYIAFGVRIYASFKIATKGVKLFKDALNKGKELKAFIGQLSLTQAEINKTRLQTMKFTTALNSNKNAILLSNATQVNFIKSLGRVNKTMKILKFSINAVKLAFKSFYPTAIFMAAWEAVVWLWDKLTNKAEDLTETLKRTKDEVEKLSKAQLELDKINLTKLYQKQHLEVANAIRTKHEFILKDPEHNQKSTLEAITNYEKLSAKLKETAEQLRLVKEAQEKLNTTNSNSNIDLISKTNALVEARKKAKAYIDNILHQQEVEIQNATKKADELKKQLEDAISKMSSGVDKQKEQELIASIEEAKQQKIKEIKEKYAKQDFTDKKNFINKTTSLFAAHYNRIKDYEAIYKRDRQKLEDDLLHHFKGTNEQKEAILKSFDDVYKKQVEDRAKLEKQKQDEFIKKERQKAKEIRLAYLKASGSLVEGMRYYEENNIKMLTNFEQGMELQQTAVRSLKSAFNDFFDAQSRNFLNFEKLGKNVLNQLLKKMLEMQVVNPLAKAGSSILSSVFSGIFGLAGYSKGGLTPNIDGVVGVLHKNEYVVPEWQVKKNWPLVQALEAERVGKKGFFRGGASGLRDAVEHQANGGTGSFDDDGHYHPNKNTTSDYNSNSNSFDRGNSRYRNELDRMLREGYNSRIADMLARAIAGNRGRIDDFSNALRDFKNFNQKSFDNFVKKFISYQDFLPAGFKNMDLSNLYKSTPNLKELQALRDKINSQKETTFSKKLMDIVKTPLKSVISLVDGVVNFVKNPSKTMAEIGEKLKNINFTDILKFTASSALTIFAPGIGASLGVKALGARQINALLGALVGKATAKFINTNLVGYDPTKKHFEDEKSQGNATGQIYDSVSSTLKDLSDKMREGLGGVPNTLNALSNLMSTNAEIARVTTDDQKDSSKRLIELQSSAKQQIDALNSANKEDIFLNIKKAYKDIFGLKAPEFKENIKADFGHLFRLITEGGSQSIRRFALDGTFLNTKNFYNTWATYAQQKNKKVDEVLDEAIASMVKTKIDFQKWIYRKDPVKLAEFNNSLYQKQLENASKQLGVNFAKITAEEFLVKYKEATAKSFDNDTLTKWNNLANIFKQATEANEELKNAQLKQIQAQKDLARTTYETVKNMYNTQVSMYSALGKDTKKIQLNSLYAQAITEYTKTNEGKWYANKGWDYLKGTMDRIIGRWSSNPDMAGRWAVSPFGSQAAAQAIIAIIEFKKRMEEMANQNNQSSMPSYNGYANNASYGRYDFSEYIYTKEQIKAQRIQDAIRTLNLRKNRGYDYLEFKDITDEILKQRATRLHGRTATTDHIQHVTNALNLLKDALKETTDTIKHFNTQTLTTVSSNFRSIVDTTQRHIDRVLDKNVFVAKNNYTFALQKALALNDVIKGGNYTLKDVKNLNEWVKKATNYSQSYFSNRTYENEFEENFEKAVSAHQFAQINNVAKKEQKTIDDVVTQLQALREENKEQSNELITIQKQLREAQREILTLKKEAS